MSKKKLLTIGTFILVFALLGVLPASAKVVKTPYTSNATMCDILFDEATFWVAGDIEHARNIKNIQYIHSADARMIGYQSATLNWNYNTKTGSGVIWGAYTTNVEGVGTWKGTVTGKMNEYRLVSEGKGVGKGYGDLDGLLAKATFYEDTVIVDDGVPEECIAYGWWSQVHTEGIIIDTTNH